MIDDGNLTSFVLQQVPRSKDIESEMTSTPVAVERHRHRTEAGQWEGWNLHNRKAI